MTTATAPAPFRDALDGYRAALDRSTILSENTQRAYASRVAAYLDWLAASDPDAFLADPLTDRHARDAAVRDYKHHLKTVQRRKPETVNGYLTAIDHFYGHLDLGPASAKREAIPTQAPRALTEAQQAAYLKAVRRSDSVRDRAIAYTSFYTGLRVSEISALDLDDVQLSARKGLVVVREGKGGKYREVDVLAHQPAHRALREWREDRHRWRGSDGPALFLGRTGGRLSHDVINDVVVGFGRTAHIDDPPVTPHVLRHTLGTRLLREGVDMAVVSRILGHGDINTTARYGAPSAADRAEAMAKLMTEEE